MFTLKGSEREGGRERERERERETESTRCLFFQAPGNSVYTQTKKMGSLDNSISKLGKAIHTAFPLSRK